MSASRSERKLWQELGKMAETSPIVHACLMAQESADMDDEATLLLIVRQLHALSQGLADELLKMRLEADSARMIKIMGDLDVGG